MLKIAAVDHPHRPQHAAYERAALEKVVNERGLDDAAQSLFVTAVSQPPQGSFAGWLWAMGELVKTLADQRKAKPPKDIDRMTDVIFLRDLADRPHHVTAADIDRLGFIASQMEDGEPSF